MPVAEEPCQACVFPRPGGQKNLLRLILYYHIVERKLGEAGALEMSGPEISGKLQLLIIGGGAIGCSLAGRLAAQGREVRLVVRDPAQAALINEQGLAVTGRLGEKQVAVPTLAGLEALEGPVDFALITTKAYDLPNAAQRLLPWLHGQSLVCALQNGVCGQTLAEIVGQARAVDTVVTWGATRQGPGEVEITAGGELLLGMAAGPAPPRLEQLRQLLEAAFPTRIMPDLFSHKLSKLLVNCCMTAIGALSGEKLGRSLRRREARAVFLRIIREGLAVAQALGVPVAPFGGRVDYYRLLQRPKWQQQLLVRLVGWKFRDLTSSSLQSLRRGQPTEVDYLNGWIVAQGQALGVPTPINSRIVAMVHELEQGQRQSCPGNLRELNQYPG